MNIENWITTKNFLEITKKFVDKKDINVLHQQVSRAIKKDKNTIFFENKEYFFRHMEGIGRGGKVLQIYSESLDSCNREIIKKDTFIDQALRVKNKKSNTETQLNYNELSESQKKQANKRLSILKEYESATKRGVCVVDFLKICKANYSDEKMNEAKLFRWKREYKNKGIVALADKRGTAKLGSTKLKQWMQEFILNKFRVHAAGGINFYQLWDALHKEASKHGDIDYYKFLLGEVRPLCDYGVIKRFVENYYRANHLEHLMVTKGEDKVKSYLQPALGNQKEIITYRNQCWQIDSSPLDVIVLDEDNKQIRPSILSIVDVYSGRCVASLDKTSNSLALVRLLWKAIEKLGKPTYVKGDNGKDYLSKQFQELLNGLGIDYDRSIAYAGDEKGVVERHFGVLQHSDISFAHGYIGSCLAQREPIEQRTPKKERSSKDTNGNAAKTNQKYLMTFQEAEYLLEEAVLKWDFMRIRRKSKVSPLDKWNSDTTKLKSVEYAEFLLYASEGIVRVVGKKGIVINNITYVARDLPLVGTDVVVRHNIDNIFEVYVFDKKGNFLCIAQDREMANLSSEDFKVSKKAFMDQTKSIRKTIRDAQTGEFSKLSLALDLEKMKEMHNLTLRKESKQNNSSIESIKEKIEEQKEFVKITTKRFDVTKEQIKQQNKKTISWDDLVNQKQKRA